MGRVGCGGTSLLLWEVSSLTNFVDRGEPTSKIPCLSKLIRDEKKKDVGFLFGWMLNFHLKRRLCHCNGGIRQILEVRILQLYVIYHVLFHKFGQFEMLGQFKELGQFHKLGQFEKLRLFQNHVEFEKIRQFQNTS
ncbi:hypothetical protein L3X38_005578 [Prunus dulcis]|uniref:Uncharacterized protein n=1 Tax=Prunus dulcis TaxID=3755 RepID=A0AAD4ZQX8_PRUDU|nr:hypothetical protein L3X38_005578 [Prunus dulcis]